MEAADIAAVVAGFGAAAASAGDAGCDGVEINAGQHSLVRQFLSGLTNQRGDEWGTDRLRFAREVITAAREGIGADRVLGLRLSCDELAPWAGITPDMATGIAADLVACGVDYVVVVRGAIFSIEQTRPDFHQPTGFNVELASCDQRNAVTRAGVPAGLDRRRRRPGRVGGRRLRRPGPLRRRRDDPRPDRRPRPRRQAARRRRRPHPAVHPLQPDVPGPRRPQPDVTCIGEPSSGRETEDPDWYVPARAAPTGGRRRCRAGGPGDRSRRGDPRPRRPRDRAGGDDRRARRRRRPERSARRVVGGRGRSPRRGRPHRRDRRPRRRRRRRAVHRRRRRPAGVRDRGRRHGRRCRRRPARDGRAPARRRRRAVRSDRRPDRRRPRRAARRAGGARHAGQHRRQRAGPLRRPRPGQRAPRPGRRAHRAPLPARARVRRRQRHAARPLQRPRSHDPVRRARRLRVPRCRPTRSPPPPCRPATASPRGRSTRRSSRAAAPRWRL